MERITSSRSTMLGLGAAAITIIGAFLAWASLLGISVSGWEGDDGKLTVVFGIALGAMAIMLKGRNRKIGMAIAGALILIVGIINWLDINDSGLDIGIGMWLTLAGGILGLVAAFLPDNG
jgi:hypothetical protein